MGISGSELVVLLILIFLLVGPEKLPELAQQLGRLTRELKKLATGAKEKVKEELGPEFQDLAAFDPRQYDPRRIVREAFMDDPPPAVPARPPAARRPTARPAPPGKPQAAAPPGLSTLAAGAAGAAGHRTLPVPPTFFFCLEMDGPRPAAMRELLGIDIARVLHGEQAFVYHAMAYAGDVLRFEPRIADIYARKGGALEFVLRETRVTDAAGSLVAELRTTTVVRNG